MRVVCIVQARMSSTRLPGKALAELGGSPLLAQQLRRLRRAETLDELVVATSRQVSDDPIVALARRERARWMRGSESDVLARFVAAARESAADLIVRVTADCPLIEPAVVDRVVRSILDSPGEADYASNVLTRTFPRGLDVESLWRDTLERLDRLASATVDREHVTTYLRWGRAELFLTRSVTDSADNSDLRWTVDTIDDLRHVQTLWRDCDAGHVGYDELLARVRSRPEWQRFDSDENSKAVA